MKLRVALGATLLTAALILDSCSSGKTQVVKAVAYPYSAATPRVFYATGAGLSETPPPPPKPEAGAPMPADQADGNPSPESLTANQPNTSVLSADAGSIYITINRWGIAALETQPDQGPASPASGTAGVQYRVLSQPLPELFHGLTTAGAWPAKDGILVQLYRDPFADGADSEVKSTAPAAGKTRLFFLKKLAPAALQLEVPESIDDITGLAKAGYQLFALLPGEKSWFAEYRNDKSDSVDLQFFEIDPASLVPPAASDSQSSQTITAREIQRAGFEAALSPKNLASLQGPLGTNLRGALASLGNQGWLVRLRSSSGQDAWYLSSGSPEDAQTAYAWADGDSISVLRQDGWLAWADTQGGHGLKQLAAPLPDAGFTALATSRGLVAAAWEEGDFPQLSAAGVVISALH